MESYFENFPAMFTVAATKNANGKVTTRTIKIPQGRESAQFFLRTTIGISKAALLIGATKGNFSGFLLGYSTIGKAKKEALDKLLKKLYAQKVKGEI